jgi:hypothetical protein
MRGLFRRTLGKCAVGIGLPCSLVTFSIIAAVSARASSSDDDGVADHIGGGLFAFGTSSSLLKYSEWMRC